MGSLIFDPCYDRSEGSEKGREGILGEKGWAKQTEKYQNMDGVPFRIL